MTAMKVVPVTATDKMIDAPRYLILYGATPGRTLEGAREHVLMSGGSIDSWPEWAKTETGHLNKATLADLIWRMMLSAVEPAPDGLVGLGYELDGVIADAERHAFDEVCLATVKRVRDALATAALTSRAAVLEEAAKNDEIEQLKAKAQVCMDLHDALGVKWGDDPYARIRRLLAAEKWADEAVAYLCQPKDKQTFEGARKLLDAVPTFREQDACSGGGNG